jgi:uncharacterized protein (UPF0332 family)
VPQRHEHLTRAGETESLARALNRQKPVCVDWAVTMLFYAALHYIDAFLAGKNLHPLNHSLRDEEIEKNGSIAEVYRDYRRLKDMSRAARYEIANFNADSLAKAEARLAKIKDFLSAASSAQP